MTSSSKTLRAPLALQSIKQDPDMPYDSPRHSLPTKKSSMIRRFLRTSTKDSKPPTVQTPLDSKPDAASSEVLGGSPLIQSPSILTTKTASSGNTTKVLPAFKAQGSLTRVKQSLTRKINARRVGAEPRVSSCTPSLQCSDESASSSYAPSSPCSRESPSSVSSASEASSVASSPRPSTDSCAQPSAADSKLDQRQSKLKRWQTRSTNKLKTWLNVHPSQRELSTVNDNQGRPAEQEPELAFEPASVSRASDLEMHVAEAAMKLAAVSHASGLEMHVAKAAIEPAAVSRVPDLEMPVVEAAIHTHSDAAGPSAASGDLLPLSSVLPLQDSTLQHRRRASEHHLFVYASAPRTLGDDRTRCYRPLCSSSRRSLDGPGRIPVRSSSLPRSFRQPLEQSDKGHLLAPSSPSEAAESYTTLDNIQEDITETAVLESKDVGEQTVRSSIESAEAFPESAEASMDTAETSIVSDPLQCVLTDQDKGTSSTDILETCEPPSMPIDTIPVDGSYSVQEVDCISTCEIPRGIVTEMLFSVNPLLKARWQPKSTVYALSTIGFWSSFHRQESLVV